MFRTHLKRTDFQTLNKLFKGYFFLFIILTTAFSTLDSHYQPTSKVKNRKYLPNETNHKNLTVRHLVVNLLKQIKCI